MSSFRKNQDRNFEPQRYRARSPNLVTAIVLWNTVYLERATQGLVEAGKPVDGELLQYLSPLGWEHINLTGDYVWRLSRRLEGVVCGRGRNPTLRLWPAIFSGEIDVFPSERRNMGQEIGR